MQHLAVGPRERGPGQSMAALLGLEDERKFQEERQNTGKEPPNHSDPLELLPGTKLGCHSASAKQNSTRLGEEWPGWFKQNGAQTSHRSGNVYAMTSQNIGSLEIIGALRPFHHMGKE